MFLFKIIVPLTRNQLLETVRGRRGGVRLARPASTINLLDVITLTEDNFTLSDSFTGNREDRSAYTSALDRALQAFQAVLAEYTIADLAANPNLETALNIIPLHREQKRLR